MSSLKYKRYAVLASSTWSFTVCFMIWMMLAVVGIPVKNELGLSETEFGILAATPVLSGSLVRVPLGIWTDRYGGRIVLFLLMLACVPAVFLMQYADHFWQFLVIGLVMGLAGGSFSVGTPYVARWFPKEQQGLAMGVFGAGNAGSALNKFLAPALIAYGTWHLVPTVYAAIMLGTAILFWFFSYSDDSHKVSSSVTLGQQLALLKDPGVLRYSQYYSVVFGGYVALALWMTKYYVGEYGLNLQTAAFLAACFSLPGGVLRAFGGYLSDKFGAYKVTWAVMWVCWVCFFILSYPQTELMIKTTHGGSVSMHIGLNVVVFTILMFTVGVAMAVGKASVFKFVADDYPTNIGAVSGIVGLAGGLGGFLLPIMFGALEDLTGIRSTSFMLLYGTVCISLIWMHFSFKAKRRELEKA
ncbi:Probable nitrate transporter narT [Neisseria animaloris]|uniref:Probable nitrate transporter narT n=1 Tax=Neisseria animaloris TaxID=326522 RepID=A0A1X3CLJ2_9NEIS|nr:nitrate/nitrite transporter [Neisseria animaloris]MDO5073277.1 nitrate/nitrite transporter [Neisseria animaloris]OSI08392.1 MFS transporter [Neisseria animaloris]VEH86778.1 Probable nitrate transporter narT [Neisseria animaloris]VEJ21089.1 Probable nitrate transporter narT [Neisseria animaloris]